ncbi:DUF590-domain-containing protein [Conidiobolus coronatus NRRL 28638]|uniref:DUF590-domain-containing protein n=1 Tax=Conidiobolus coronatus (strain ATCC 28846 / CBS 209.66 / NRRL 28638) TaxID=796925 RepID=A0A137P883_CONC2|nr:DUF590-domain-containing protein [Conidiobolus coronatus NRRL 28638]|eukprot:KXN71141.1 DUF590-domain-containing protein [Conidiobolus coronatus NRRL 28638]
MELRNRSQEGSISEKNNEKPTHKREQSLDFDKIPKTFIKNHISQCKNDDITPNEYSDFIIVFDSQIGHEPTFVDKLFGEKKKTVDKAKRKEELQLELTQVYKKLIQFGFKVEYSQFSNTTIAYFLTAPKDLIFKGYQKERVEDYLGGMRVNDLDKLFSDSASSNSIDNFSPSKRLRIIHNLLVLPTISGGLGLSDNSENSFIKEVYPVHERKFDKKWIKRISTKLYINDKDLDTIKDHSGSQIALYFAFLQFYTAYLIPMSVIGLFVYLFVGSPSYVNSFFLLVWSTLFPVLWKRRQKDLAYRWDNVNCSKVELPRSAFKPDEYRVDPVTEHMVPVVSPLKFIQRQVKSLGYVALCSLFLSIVLREFYNGPYLDIVAFIPSIVGGVVLSNLYSIYQSIAQHLTLQENHPTESKHAFFLTQKVFIMNFLMSYYPILFAAWFYVPYCQVLIKWIDSHLFKVHEFELPGLARVQQPVIYMLVTGQLVNHFVETGLPYLLKFFNRGLRNYNKKKEGENENSTIIQEDGQNEIVEEELDDFSEDESSELDLNLFQKVKTKLENEYHELQQYDIYQDYCEMAVQFGHIIFFGTIWPLAPLACLANNWLELRTDTIKILFNYKRPIPKRVEDIGAWMDQLNFLVWCSSLINPILLYQFSKTRSQLPDIINFPAWVILILVWEHFYFFLNGLYHFVVKLYPSTADTLIQQENYALKKKMMNKTVDEFISQVNSPSCEVDLIGSPSGSGSLGRTITGIQRCVDKMFETDKSKTN